MKLMMNFYDWMMRGLQPWVRRKLRNRSQSEPLYGQAIEERFGCYEHPPANVDLWLHAVSLGETRAAALLLESLRVLRPELKILLTHGTATGRQQGRALLRPGDRQAWQPWDTRASIESLLAHFCPKVIALIETEVWPNWVAVAKQHQIPMILLNARMSEKSMHKALRLDFLSRAAFSNLTEIWAQSPADAQRLDKLGTVKAEVIGNLKFDAHPDLQQIEQGRWLRGRLKRPVVLLASSREGEEKAWLQTLKNYQQTGWTCWIVPRHPQRFDEVAQLIADHCLTLVRRSQFPSLGLFDESMLQLLNESHPVVLGDSLGEMAFYYSVASIALLGGSFEKLGGQNLIESLACGCPIITGPHIFNFAQASELAKNAGACVEVADFSAAREMVHQLLQQPDLLNSMSHAGMNFSAAHQGVAKKMAVRLLPYLA